jgi:Ca2+-binding EF-hand superfamily protein
MLTFHSSRRMVASLACVFALTFSSVSIAADTVVSFATGGYASSLRSEELMKKMSDGTGMLTKDEWIAFHEKIFTMLDKKHTGIISSEEYISATGGGVVTFATGGYARGLRSKDMMDKIDTDQDGTISHAEFMTYLTKLFDMMDTSAAHKGTITKEEVMFATGGYNRTP